MTHRRVTILLFLCLLFFATGCIYRTNDDLRPPVYQEIDITLNDSILFAGAGSLDDTVVERLFLEDKKPTQLTPGSFKVDSDIRWALYFYLLIEKNELFELEKFADYLSAKFVFRTDGCARYPVFYYKANPWLVYTMLEYYAFYQGFSIEERAELYRLNLTNTVLWPEALKWRFQIKYQYYLTLIEILNDSENGEVQYRNFLNINSPNQSWQQYTRMDEILRVGLLLESENIFAEPPTSVLHWGEQLLRDLIKVAIYKEAKFTTKLIESYRLKFPNFCLADFLRIGNFDGTHNSIYLENLKICMGTTKGYDSLRTIIYHAQFLLRNGLNDSASIVLNSHREMLDICQQRNFPNYNRLTDMYNVLRLAVLIARKAYSQYVFELARIDRPNILLGLRPGDHTDWQKVEDATVGLISMCDPATRETETEIIMKVKQLVE